MLSISTDDERIGSDLVVALARVVRRLRQGHVPGDLTLSEASVLSRLDRGGAATPGDLAADEHVRPQAMGATVAALEGRGLVGRAGDPADGRRVLISVTGAGRELLTRRRDAKARRMAQALATFTPAERDHLARAAVLLDRLADAL